jgi:hypothetical protein|tara:strand:- start:1304 stop:2020 length:717 start_codon:yes stop_codon:yes gene_type:complete
MGLHQGDLKDLVYNIFEIDSYKSKMGNDKDIVTLSFSTLTKESGEDLVDFIEKGYNFVLDADVTAGEQSDGTYKVFVEMERKTSVPQEIMELINGLKSLCELDEFKYRYYKSFDSTAIDEELLGGSIPLTAEDYEMTVNESNLNNYKNFFNKSYIEDIIINENTIKIKKAYADPLLFEYITFNDKQTILETINGKFDLMESYPEILFLTKYVGDYNISKYGDSLVFENEDKALVLKRI